MWSRRNWPFTLHKTWHSNSTMRSQFSGQKVLLSFHCFEEPTVLHTIQVTKVLHQVSSTVLSCKQNKVIWLATHELLMIRDRFLTLCKGVFSEMITNVWKPILVDQRGWMVIMWRKFPWGASPRNSTVASFCYLPMHQHSLHFRHLVLDNYER